MSGAVRSPLPTSSARASATLRSISDAGAEAVCCGVVTMQVIVLNGLGSGRIIHRPARTQYYPEEAARSAETSRMLEQLGNTLAVSGFLPHGYCFQWTPGLLWAYVLSDSLIALAYYTIPAGLWYFTRKRVDLPFNWIFVMFGLFILACGTTHVVAVWNIWEPVYWLDAGVKAVTAGVSVATAIVLWPLIPKALRLPSPAQMMAVNRELEREIAERRMAERRANELAANLEAKV